MKLRSSAAEMGKGIASSSSVVRGVCQRLATRKPPTLRQTEELLEQLAVAETEIGLLRAALLDATEALSGALQSLAREEHERAVGGSPTVDSGKDQRRTLAAMYNFLLTRAWEHSHPEEQR